MSQSLSYSTTKIVAALLGVALVASLLVGFGVQQANAQSTSLKDLVELFISLGIIAPEKAAAARAAVSGGPVSTGSYTFTRNLTVGSTGEDVRELQKFLNANGFTVSSSGAGSAGSESTYFGPATRAALAKYQAANGISPAAGYFGPITRTNVNGKVAGTPGPSPSPSPSPTPTPTPGTGVTVSSPTQPAAGLAPESAARVAFTKITLTAGTDGDVTVNSLTIERSGLANDSAFGGVVLLDENGTQLGLEKTFNSNHQAIIGEALTVKAGTSKTLTIAGNMAADNDARAGQVASIKIVAVNTSAAVSGSLPIEGAAHTINSTLAIGSVTNERGPLDPNAAQTKNVGTTGYTFSSVKVTAGSTEDVRLWSIRWNQASSAGASDLANVVTVVSGTEYPTTISSDGKFYTSTFPGGILVPKGLSKEVSVKADIVGGSGRTAAFNIEKTTDIYLTGEVYKYGITPPTSGTGFTSGTIWYAGKTVTIDNGSLTIENATSVPSQNIAANKSNEVIGGFTAEVKGEPITVASMTFNVATTGTPGTTSGGTNQLLTNVTIVDQNGTVVAGPVDATASTATVQRLTFSDTVLFSIGKNTYTIKGKVGSNFASDGTLITSVTPGGSAAPRFSSVTGQVTGKTITPSTAAVTMNTMTVKGAALTVSVSPDPAAQTIVSGAQGFTFANYQLSALQSGEDLTISSLPLAYHAHGGSTATNLTNCNLYEGTKQLTTGSNSLNPSSESSSTTLTFDSPLTVPKGTTKALALKCNVASGGTGAYSWGYDDAQSITATGVTSSQSATVTENESAGQKITLSAGGALRIAKDSSSPSYTVAAAGTTGNTVGVFRVSADTEAIELTDFALQISFSASSTPADITKVTLYDGASKIGETVFQGKNYTASTTIGTCSGCSKLVIPKDGDKLVTAKVDLGAQGVGQVGLPGTLVAVDWDNASGDATKGIGQSSGTTIQRTNGSDTAVDGVRVYKAYPTLALIDLPTTKLVTGRQDLFRFKVTASPHGDVGIYHVTFRISTSSVTSQSNMINNTNVYVFTDSSYSTVASGLQSDGAMAANNLPGDRWATASSDLTIGAADSTPASTTVVIPAGQTRYFAIRGDVTTAGTQFSASTQLQGDAKFVADLTANPYCTTAGCIHSIASSTYLASSTYIISTGDNDFIWRPFSTTTSQAVGALDYTTGYGIPGLTNTNTNLQILTQ